MTALFEAQTSRAKEGTYPHEHAPNQGYAGRYGLDRPDPFTCPALATGNAGSVTVNDKKLRQLDDTLVRLAAAGLVILPNAKAGANKRAGLELLDEGGQRPQGRTTVIYAEVLRERHLQHPADPLHAKG